MSVDHFREKIGNNEEEIVNWFSDIRGIKSHCKKSSEAQKDYKNSLKHEIDEAKFKINKTLKINTLEKKLLNLDEKSKEFSEKIAQKFWPDLDEREREQKHEKFNSIFSFCTNS